MTYMKLFDIVSKYGKAAINSLTKYPSIQTLHKMGEKGALTDDLNITSGQFWEIFNTPATDIYATETIDGTNVRLVCYGKERLVGSREQILHHNHDLYWGSDLGIVDSIYDLEVPFPTLPQFTVIYGELYGGSIGANSKQYGNGKRGFRVFDVATWTVDELESLLSMTPEEISRWREHDGKFGQKFMDRSEFRKFTDKYGFETVPEVVFDPLDTSHTSVLAALKSAIPETEVKLTDTALMKPEGVIWRNADRSMIVKVRYEDYERTLKGKK